jgi:hypothetical protein
MMVFYGAKDQRLLGAELTIRTNVSIYPITTHTEAIVIYRLKTNINEGRSNRGKIITQKDPIQGVGYLGRCLDTEGNAFCTIEFDKNAKQLIWKVSQMFIYKYTKAN